MASVASRTRVAMCKRERYLSRLAARWITAAEEGDREELDKVAVPSVVAPVEYGIDARYGGGGRPNVDQDLQDRFDLELDRIFDRASTPVESAEYLETALATPESKRRLPFALKAHAADLLRWLAGVSQHRRGLQPRQVPVVATGFGPTGLTVRTLSRFVPGRYWPVSAWESGLYAPRMLPRRRFLETRVRPHTLSCRP